MLLSALTEGLQDCHCQAPAVHLPLSPCVTGQLLWLLVECHAAELHSPAQH